MFKNEWACRNCYILLAKRPESPECPVCGYKGPSETGAGRRNWYEQIAPD